MRLRRDREQRGDAAHGAPVEEGRGARGAPRGARPDEREQRAEKGTAVEERCAAGLPLDVVREQRLCAAANGEERDFAAAPLRGGAGRGYTERRAERAGERAEERRAPRLARGAAEQIEEEIAAGGTHVSHRRHVILLRDELLRVRAPRAVLRRGHLHQGERRLDERHDELDAQRVLEQRLAARLEQHAVDVEGLNGEGLGGARRIGVRARARARASDVAAAHSGVKLGGAPGRGDGADDDLDELRRGWRRRAERGDEAREVVKRLRHEAQRGVLARDRVASAALQEERRGEREPRREERGERALHARVRRVAVVEPRVAERVDERRRDAQRAELARRARTAAVAALRERQQLREDGGE